MVSKFIQKIVKNKPKEQTILPDFLDSVRDELNDHLDAINANSDEIVTTHDYVAQVEEKIEKLNEKIDDIQAFLGMKVYSKPFLKKITLTLREQEVFCALLFSTKGLSVDHLSQQLGITEYLVKNYIDSIAAKGVPLIRRLLSNERILISLDEKFREMQVKEHVVPLSDAVVQQFS